MLDFKIVQIFVTVLRMRAQVLVFTEGGNLENPEKNPRSKDKNQQQTQPTCDTSSGNRTWAKVVGGKRMNTASSLLPQGCRWIC